MNRLILLLALLFALFNADAQSYDSAVGARLGSPLSVSYKRFVSENNAIEVYAGGRFQPFVNWFIISGGYQLHKPLLEEEIAGLRWYYGFGGTVSFLTFDQFFIGDSGTSTLIGAQGYLGLDYTFKDIPLNLSIDWVPTVFVNGFASGFGAGFGALSARYILNRQN